MKTHKNGGGGRHQKTSSSTQADPCFHLQNGKPAPDIEALNLSYSGLAISMSQGSFRSGMSAIVFLLRYKTCNRLLSIHSTHLRTVSLN